MTQPTTMDESTIPILKKEFFAIGTMSYPPTITFQSCISIIIIINCTIILNRSQHILYFILIMQKKQNLSTYKLIQTTSAKPNKTTGLYKNAKLAMTNILIKKFNLSKQIQNYIIEQEINKLKSLNNNILIGINNYEIEQRKDQMKVLIIEEQNVSFRNLDEYILMNKVGIRHFIAIAKTLGELHQKNIMHGNLHLKNIFFDSFKQKILFNDVYFTFLNKSQKLLSKNRKQIFKNHRNLSKFEDIKQLGVIYRQILHKSKLKEQTKEKNELKSRHLQDLIQIICSQSQAKPTLYQIIQQLGQNRQEYEIRKPRQYKNIYLSINLVSMCEKRQTRFLECSKIFKKQINKSIYIQCKIYKIQEQREYKILEITASNQSKNIIMVTSFTYKYLNQQIKQYFKNIDDLYNFLQNINHNYLDLIQSGSLIFSYRIKINNLPSKEIQFKIQSQEKIKQQLKQLPKEEQAHKDNINDKKVEKIKIQSKQIIEQQKQPLKIKDQNEMSSDQQDNAIQKMYLKLPNYQKQLTEIKKMLKIAIDLQKPPHQTTYLLYEMMGKKYQQENNWQIAKRCYKIALKGYQKDKDIINQKVINLLNNLGILYCNLKQPLKGVNLIQKSIKLAKQIGSEQSSLVLRYTNLGKIYLTIQNFKESEKWFKLSLQYHKKIKTQQSKLKTLQLNLNLSSLYIKQQNYQKSNNILTQSIKTKLLLRRKQDIQLMYFNLGYGLIKLNKLQEGLKKYLQCFQSIIKRQSIHDELYEQMEKLIVASFQQKQMEFKKQGQKMKKWINNLKKFMNEKHKIILEGMF